jgi:uridine kinase
MELTAQEVYLKTVSIMQPNERLRLAALILRDLTETEKELETYSNNWNEKDKEDLAFATLRYAEEIYPEEQELV